MPCCLKSMHYLPSHHYNFTSSTAYSPFQRLSLLVHSFCTSFLEYCNFPFLPLQNSLLGVFVLYNGCLQGYLSGKAQGCQLSVLRACLSHFTDLSHKIDSGITSNSLALAITGAMDARKLHHIQWCLHKMQGC